MNTHLWPCNLTFDNSTLTLRICTLVIGWLEGRRGSTKLDSQPSNFWQAGPRPPVAERHAAFLSRISRAAAEAKSLTLIRLSAFLSSMRWIKPLRF